jgi:toxin CptA
MTSAPAIGFDYRPSRWPARLLGVVVTLALAAIVTSGAPWWLQLLLSAASLAFAAQALRRASRTGVAGVGLAGERWTLYRGDRSETPATLASSRVLGTCVLLRLKCAGETVVLLLAPDNSDADLRRRLRMRLAAMQPVAHGTDR